MGMIGLGAIVVLLAFAIYIWLDHREKKRVAGGLPRHAGWRLAFAAIALLTMLFSGGCGGLFMASWIADGMRSNDYVGWEIIAVFSLPPFLVSALIWWLSMRRKSG